MQNFENQIVIRRAEKKMKPLWLNWLTEPILTVSSTQK